ncbi:UNVERIFIED_ORG: hypothetical protein QQG_4285, partial [Clostridioides difficile Y384]
MYIVLICSLMETLMRIPHFHNKIIIFSVLINVKDTRRVG